MARTALIIGIIGQDGACLSAADGFVSRTIVSTAVPFEETIARMVRAEREEGGALG